MYILIEVTSILVRTDQCQIPTSCAKYIIKFIKLGRLLKNNLHSSEPTLIFYPILGSAFHENLINLGHRTANFLFFKQCAAINFNSRIFQTPH